MGPVSIKGLRIGVDIGQKVDPTAIVVAEVGERDNAEGRTYEGYREHPITGEAHYNLWVAQESCYTVRHMERLPLGTSYPDVAKRIVEVALNVSKHEYEQRLHGDLIANHLSHLLYVDQTGVGAPVVDIVREALRLEPEAKDWSLWPVTFRHRDQKYDRTAKTVGKAFIVSTLQALFQRHAIELPKGHAEAEAMARELQSYEIRVDANANDQYGAFKVGSHDDLVTALGLAVMESPGAYRSGYIHLPW
jgi:hypothetical protein